MAEFTAEDELNELIVETQKKVEKIKLAYVRGVTLSDYEVMRVLENLTRIVSAQAKKLDALDKRHA